MIRALLRYLAAWLERRAAVLLLAIVRLIDAMLRRHESRSKA